MCSQAGVYYSLMPANSSLKCTYLVQFLSCSNPGFSQNQSSKPSSFTCYSSLIAQARVWHLLNTSFPTRPHYHNKSNKNRFICIYTQAYSTLYKPGYVPTLHCIAFIHTITNRSFHLYPNYFLNLSSLLLFPNLQTIGDALIGSIAHYSESNSDYPKHLHIVKQFEFKFLSGKRPTANCFASYSGRLCKLFFLSSHTKP